MRRGDFPPLRDTAEWERQEKRRTYIVGGLVLALFIVAMILGGCNGAHGRC